VTKWFRTTAAQAAYFPLWGSSPAGFGNRLHPSTRLRSEYVTGPLQQHHPCELPAGSEKCPNSMTLLSASQKVTA
jgi:hypothetical protein